MNAKNFNRLEYVEILERAVLPISFSQALSSLPYFLVYRLGYSQDVMYNISIAYTIQNVLGIFLTNHARVIAALIFSYLEDI